ncbi:hypothetical protein HYZ70_02035 [Candidatus Curtissbacteria bacterium]|nr:hypothetical protein [Candidatus Curtissbacteria bacterium]
MTVGILGLGQVGKAIEQLCKNHYRVVGRDLTADGFAALASLDILHVCIPYSKTFEETVIKTIKDFRPTVTIIDSTVRPGTTQSIFKKTKVNIAHAPILGRHPVLARYQKIFVKPLGCINNNTYKIVKAHFKKIGVRTTSFSSPLESELAKILDTTYYAWNIFFEKWVWDVCHKTGAKFEDVYTRFNQIYNLGYAKQLPNVRRPIMTHQPGPIGGHCIIPNLRILSEWLADDAFVGFMLNQNENLG